MNGCYYSNDANILKEMLGKRPDELEGETLKLFEAIMKIADERDELKARYKELEDNIHKEHTLGYSQGVYDCSEAWKEKIQEKVIEIKNKPVKDEFITTTQGKLDTIIAIEQLLEE